MRGGGGSSSSSSRGSVLVVLVVGGREGFFFGAATRSDRPTPAGCVAVLPSGCLTRKTPDQK